MLETLKSNFRLYFPKIYTSIIEFVPHGKWEILGKAKDGRIWIYDDFDQTIRYVPKDYSDLSEEECKYNFGKRLEKILYHKFISQTELSQMTGIPQPQISNYIRGKTSPTYYNLHKIATALNCSMDELRYF